MTFTKMAAIGVAALFPAGALAQQIELSGSLEAAPAWWR